MLPFIKNQIENYSILEKAIETPRRNALVLFEDGILLNYSSNGERKQQLIEQPRLAEILLKFNMIDFKRGSGADTTMHKKYFTTVLVEGKAPVMIEREKTVKVMDLEFDELTIHAMCVYMESTRIAKIIQMIPRKAA